MANIDHAAKRKAIKAQLYYLDNREAILAKAKERRDAAQAVTETVTVTKSNGTYSLQLGDLKLVVSPDATVAVSKIITQADDLQYGRRKAPKPATTTQTPAVELKPNGKPYKTSEAKRRASAKYNSAHREAGRAYSRQYYQDNKEAILASKKEYYQTEHGKAVNATAQKRFIAKQKSAQNVTSPKSSLADLNSMVRSISR